MTNQTIAPAFELALHDMLSSYSKGDEASKNQASAKLVKSVNVKAVKLVDTASKSQAIEAGLVPATNGSKTEDVKVERIDAKGFLLALRNAGSRVGVDGKRFVDPIEQRPDTIKAITAYVGYDPNGDFASQELAARSAATRELRRAKGEVISAGPSRQEQRILMASLSGFTTGLPDNFNKAVANLEARERLAVEAIIEQEKLAETAPTEQERAKALAFAQVERERLVQIRHDLDASK